MLRELLVNQRDPNRIAIIHNGKCISYSEIIQLALGISEELSRLPDEIVALLLPNGPDYIAAFFGVLMAGKAVFPINVHLSANEIIYPLRQAGVNTIITNQAGRMQTQELTAVSETPIQIIVPGELEKHSTEDSHLAAFREADSMSVLLNTSGTTGNIKNVALSEQNIISSVQSYLDRIEHENGDLDNAKYIIATPFCSAYGMMVFIACIWKSITIVQEDGLFTIDKFCRIVEEYQVTHYEGGATTLILMEQALSKLCCFGLEPLKCVGFGGSKIPTSTINRLAYEFPDVKFSQGYGMTEAAPLIAKFPQIDDPEMFIKKAASVGKAVGDVKIFIDANSSLTIKPYTTGEIVVKGPNVMTGYYRNKEETDKILRNGYLYTGDIGYLDDEGFLYIIGRKKNIVIINGLNVSVEEVEECLLKSDVVKDCRVYGRVGKYGVEQLCADIVFNEVSDQDYQLQQHIQHNLACYKQPSIINTVNYIEKTVSGKKKRTNN